MHVDQEPREPPAATARRWPRRVAWGMLIAVVLVYGIAVGVSWAGSGWIEHEVEIDAPVSAVWEYGSDSTRAAEWSVYFHHITPVEGDGRPADGQLGSLRVCYRLADETGPRWDETTEAVIPYQYREIRTFNLVGFPLAALSRGQEFEVRQHYRALDQERSALRFRSRLTRDPGVASTLLWPLREAGWILVGSLPAEALFEWNLENIAAAVEARHSGTTYERPHPYDPSLDWEERPVRWHTRAWWDELRGQV
jgi:hypothetical protein